MEKGMFTSLSGEWETPREVFAFAERKWGPFDLDAAANEHNHLCDNYCGTDGSYIDGIKVTNDSGLTADWTVLSAYGPIWLNPPYGRGMNEWVQKCAAEVTNKARIVALLPARTDTRWFKLAWETCSEIAFLSGRLKFLLEGEPQGTAPFPSMLARWDGTLGLRSIGPTVWLVTTEYLKESHA